MDDPLSLLLATALALAGAVWLFRPVSGHFWRWRSVRRLTERVLIEDGLKHLYSCEYRMQGATVESLAGALGITANRAADLLVGAEARGLVRSEGGVMHLTSAGRDYALRILRVHRLWEQYLAEETGFPEADWHGEAERREHDLSLDQADLLAQRMGDPVYDPHGDPIPTASGDIPPSQGQPLANLPVGVLGRIVHIEDEPGGIYAQLVAEGLQPGMRVEVTEVSSRRIRLWADGEPHVLAPVVAANVTVIVLPADQKMEGPYEPLSALVPGEAGRVIRISRACRGPERRRLMDLGILPGTEIEAEMRSPGGDPTAYRVRDSLVALRKEQASYIHIARHTETA